MLKTNLKYFKAPIEDLASTVQGDCSFCNKKDSIVFNLDSSRKGCVNCLADKKFQLGGQLVEGGWYIKGKHYFFCPEQMDEILSKPQPKVTEEAIEELAYTPCYKDQQGYSVWPICCQHFPVYIGKWKPGDFIKQVGKELFTSLIDEEYVWEETFAQESQEDWALDANVYMFKCEKCSNYKAYWDCT